MVVGMVSLSMEQPRKSNFLVPLMCSPTYHVGAPRTRPHEMWVCKKAKSIVIGFSGGIEGNYIGWTGGVISWRPMMGTSLFSSSSHFFMSQLCRIYVTHCSKCYNEIQILLFLL